METSIKVRENKARRVAARQRYTLVKSSRRDRRAWDYGLWWMVHEGGVIGADKPGGVAGDPPGLSLEEVERLLDDDDGE